jgi:hypothetical protein
VSESRTKLVVAAIAVGLLLALLIVPRMRGRNSGSAASESRGSDTSGHKILWKFKSDRDGFTSIALGPDGTIYAGTNNALYALTPDGNPKWKITYAGMLYLSVAADGTVYAASSHGLAFGTGSDGKIVWDPRMGMIGFGAPAAIGASGQVFYANTVSDLFAFDPMRSNSALWTQNTFREGALAANYTLGGSARVGGAQSKNSPVIWRDETIVLARQHWLNYFYPDGSPGWTKELTAGTLGQPALDDDGVTFVADDRHTLYAVDRRGDLKWQYDAGEFIVGSPVIGQDGAIYITTSRNVHALGPDGSVKWSAKAPQQSMSSAAISADGTLYVGGDAGLFALRPDGSEKWSMRTGSVNNSPTIAADGTIYFPCGYMWICATRDEGSPLAKSPWPKMFHDAANTNRILTTY